MWSAHQSAGPTGEPAPFVAVIARGCTRGPGCAQEDLPEPGWGETVARESSARGSSTVGPGRCFFTLTQGHMWMDHISFGETGQAGERGLHSPPWARLLAPR